MVFVELAPPLFLEEVVASRCQVFRFNRTKALIEPWVCVLVIRDNVIWYKSRADITQMIPEVVNRFVDMRFPQNFSSLALFEFKLQSIPVGALEIPVLARDSFGLRDDNVQCPYRRPGDPPSWARQKPSAYPLHQRAQYPEANCHGSDQKHSASDLLRAICSTAIRQ